VIIACISYLYARLLRNFSLLLSLAHSLTFSINPKKKWHNILVAKLADATSAADEEIKRKKKFQIVILLRIPPNHSLQ
jgi:hypothetical protein